MTFINIKYFRFYMNKYFFSILFLFFFILVFNNSVLSHDEPLLVLLPVENLSNQPHFIDKAIHDIFFFKSLKLHKLNLKNIIDVQRFISLIPKQRNMFDLASAYCNKTEYENFIIINYSLNEQVINMNINLYNAVNDDMYLVINQTGHQNELSNLIDDVLLVLMEELNLTYSIQDMKKLTTLHFDGFEIIRNIYESIFNSNLQTQRLVRLMENYSDLPLINYYIGKELFHNNLIEESYDYFLKETSLNSENYLAYVYLSKCYEFFDDKRIALSLIQELNNTYPGIYFIENRLADLYYANKNYRAALAIYRKLVLLNYRDKDDKLIHTLGDFYFQLKDYETSMHYYEELKRTSPNLIFSYRELGHIYHELNRLDKAIENYKIYLNLNPDPDIFYKLGQLSIKTENYEDALTFLSNVESTNRNNPVYYIMLGDAYYQLGIYEEAVKSYFSVIKFLPDNYNANFRLALSNLKLRNFDIAKLYFEKSLNIAATPEVYYYLGYISFEHDFETAEKDFALAEAKFYLNKATELDENYFDAFMLLGEIHLYNSRGIKFGQGADLNKAGEYFTIAANIDKSDYRPLYKLGVIMAEVKNYYLAEIYLKNSINLNPHHKKSYFLLGDIYIELEYYQFALEIYFELLKVMPDNIDVYLKLSQIYIGLSDFVRAINSLTEAFVIDSQHPDVLAYLGKVYIETQDYEKGVQFLNDAIKIDSSNLMALKLLADVYKHQLDDKNLADYYQSRYLFFRDRN